MIELFENRNPNANSIKLVDKVYDMHKKSVT